jgi:hypothetical protein
MVSRSTLRSAFLPQTDMDFLGHQVTVEGVAPLCKHVEALKQLPVPADVKQFQRFWGLINFYLHFLSGIAGTLKPLTDALKGNPKWLEVTEAMKEAVETAKAVLEQHLVHPGPATKLA